VEGREPVLSRGVDASPKRIRGLLSAPLLEGWSLLEEKLSVAKGSDPPANVIVSSEVISEPIDAAEFARREEEKFNEFPGYHQVSLEPLTVFGGHAGWLRRFEWQPPDATPVTQLQVYCVVGARAYTATATAPTANFEALELDLAAVLEGLRVADEPEAPLVAGAQAPPAGEGLAQAAPSRHAGGQAGAEA
jgi:hypothetical protein